MCERREGDNEQGNELLHDYRISFSMAAKSLFASSSAVRIVPVGGASVPVRAPDPTNALIKDESRCRTGCTGTGAPSAAAPRRGPRAGRPAGGGPPPGPPPGAGGGPPPPPPPAGAGEPLFEGLQAGGFVTA